MTINHLVINKFLEYNIKNISIDSRDIKEQTAFFAIKGMTQHGFDFIQDALDNGACLIITDKEVDINSKKILIVDNVNSALLTGINILYPKKVKNIVGITGTNGKTSICYFSSQILSLLGKKSSSMGTLGLKIMEYDRIIDQNNEIISHLTSDTYLDIRKKLNFLYNKKVDYVFCETSSHGLHQNRFQDIMFDICVFSSFSQDHLNYHHTMNEYLSSKLLLFSKHIKNNGLAIICSNIKELNQITSYIKSTNKNIKIITVGHQGDCKIIKTKNTINSIEVTFCYQEKIYSITLAMIGLFNATNILISIISAHYYGYNLDEIVKIINMVKPPPGRLCNANIKNRDIFVDFAHNPESLEEVLKNISNIKKNNGKLILVFGCGGNRDKAKRSIMGKIASHYADIIIVTDDNPRNENPESIRKEIILGIQNKNMLFEIGNRKDAIEYGLQIMKKKDIMIITGKGNEALQVINNKKHKFNELSIIEDYYARHNMV